MGPKVDAACDFAERSGKTAAIGALEDIPRILAGEAGTLVSNGVATIEWAAAESLPLFTE
jgi:carbamate kinase